MNHPTKPRILIQNGRVIDPVQKLDRVTNLLIEDGKIAAYDAPLNGQDVVLDATDKIISPGLIDLHVELREPGWEEDETIATGTAAALAGGFTSIACIPNTDPPIDTQAGVEFVQHQAERARTCNVHVLACVSKNRKGEELAEIGMLVEAGAIGFTDAELPIHNPELLRRALEYCLMFDKPILNHPEVLELSHDGIMHDGLLSMILGLKGLPTEAEDMMTARDLRLAEATGGRLHLMNISSAESVELIRRAKTRGVTVTAEVSPHNFSLTDESLRSFNSNCKVNPPLRDQRCIDACVAGLQDGTLDVIASSHAPRASEKKMQELDQAPFGISALETALALVISELIEPGHLNWDSALEKLTVNPARVLGLAKGTLEIGADADVTIIDPHHQWTVTRSSFRSKSCNTPYLGRSLKGRADTVLVGGEVRFQVS
jgi:dihydroorotase